MSIRMGGAAHEAYKLLLHRHGELYQLRLARGMQGLTVDELREWFSVSVQMAAIEMEYADGSYRPIGSGSIAAVADAESYEFELRWAGGFSAPELE